MKFRYTLDRQFSAFISVVDGIHRVMQATLTRPRTVPLMRRSNIVLLALILSVVLVKIGHAKEVFLTFEWLGQVQFLAGFEVQVVAHGEFTPLFVFELPAASPCDPALNNRTGAHCAYIGCLPSAHYDLYVFANGTQGQRSLHSNQYTPPPVVADPGCETVEPALFFGFVGLVPPPPPELPETPPAEIPFLPNVVNLRCPFAK